MKKLKTESTAILHILIAIWLTKMPLFRNNISMGSLKRKYKKNAIYLEAFLALFSTGLGKKTCKLHFLQKKEILEKFFAS